MAPPPILGGCPPPPPRATAQIMQTLVCCPPFVFPPAPLSNHLLSLSIPGDADWKLSVGPLVRTAGRPRLDEENREQMEQKKKTLSENSIGHKSFKLANIRKSQRNIPQVPSRYGVGTRIAFENMTPSVLCFFILQKAVNLKFISIHTYIDRWILNESNTPPPPGLVCCLTRRDSQLKKILETRAPESL